MAQQCPFCHFINNKPEDLWVVGETENFYAWLEYPEPRAKGQTNIVPKEHKESVLEFTENEWKEAMDLLRVTVKKIMKGLDPDGASVTVNIKRAGGQMVPHAYIQVFPRFNEDENAGTPTGAIFSKKEELQDDRLFEEIQNLIKSAKVDSGRPPKQRARVGKHSEKTSESQKNKDTEDEGCTEDEDNERNKNAAEQWKKMKRGGY